MIPIGETLRRERLRRNLDLNEISRELKIAPYMLEAIEREQFEKLPGGVFAKSFVRQYASLLGLDADEMAAQVARVVDPAPEFRENERPDVPPLAGLRLRSLKPWQRIGDRGPFGLSSWIKSVGVLVLATVACSAVYVLWERARVAPQTKQTATVRTEPAPAPPAQEQQMQPPVTQSEPGSPAAAATEVPATAQPVPQQVAAPAAGLADRAVPPQPQSAAVTASGNVVHIQITADEPVWVRARNNGKYLFSGTLDAKQTRTVDAEGAVELLLGNAGGVEIQLNGKPVGSLGPKGQVRTVQFTSGGFTVVPPKPAAPPAPL